MPLALFIRLCCIFIKSKDYYMAISKESKIVASDMSSLINGLSISGNTITYTKVDGSSGTITTQNTNTDNMIPSDNYIELDTSTRTYTPPANGWFTVQFDWTHYTVVKIYNTNTLLGNTFQQYGSGNKVCIMSIPCKKGDSLKIEVADGSATFKKIRFIYAEGSL